VDDVNTFHRLRSVPGIGKILALVLLYEIHDIRRFPEVGNFLSYARLVRCAHESGGKKLGSGGKKIGNPHLRWAFAEAACLFLRQSERAKNGWRVRKRNVARARHSPSSPPNWLGPCITCCTRRSPSTRHASGRRDADTSCEDFAGIRADDQGAHCRPPGPPLASLCCRTEE
jgi:Transposase IS116/IS110/IS902 family